MLDICLDSWTFLSLAPELNSGIPQKQSIARTEPELLYCRYQSFRFQMTSCIICWSFLVKRLK